MISMRKHQRDHFQQAAAPPPRTQTELKRRNRTLSFSGARLAVEWLNGTKGKAAYERVLRIREEFEQLGAMLDSLHKQWETQKQDPLPQREDQEAWRRRGLEGIAHGELRETFRKRHNALNEALSAYAFQPVMVYDPSLELSVWRYSAVPRNPRGPFIAVSDGNQMIRVSAANVVSALAQLAANREFFKVHLCDQCREKWHSPQRKMDRFCSGRCRERFRQTDEESRARHARAQAEHRKRLNDIT
jgi:hypothetical protein